MNFSSVDFYRLLAAAPIILLALSTHEFAHAYVSYRLGDPTAARAGRLTLLPWAHLDFLGTLMIVITSLTGIGFGWAKPVPINPAYFRNPVRGVFLVSLAGPGANLCLALLFGLLIRIVPFYSLPLGLMLLLTYGVAINLGLMLFNLLPVPPLDGSGILTYFLRGPIRERYQRLQPYGVLILLMLLITGAAWWILGPPFEYLYRLLTGIS